MPGKRVSKQSDPREIQDDQPGSMPTNDDEEEEWVRKTRSDADQPRMWQRDIGAFRWIGEQGAANTDDLRELLGREAAGPTNQPGLLTKTRIRHIIEKRWLPAKMVYSDTMLGKKWVWPTKRALQRAGLPFATHRPADVNLNHLHHCNRIRLYLERCYSGEGQWGSWESERMIELSKKDWKAKHKADPSIYIPSSYEMWHMPDAIWRFRDRGDTQDYQAYIEVEVSQKRPEKLNEIVLELARHGTTWYYADMDPRKGVYKGLMDALNTLTDRLLHYKENFWIYDLADPNTLVYHYEAPKKKSG